MKNLNNTLAQLKNEINETLYFLIESDLKIYGFITKGTEEAFNTQHVIIPDEFLPFRHVKKQLSDLGVKIKDELRYYTGCEQPFRHPLFKELVYTDGVKYLATEAKAYWLLDIIGSVLNTLKKHSFVSIKLNVYRLGNGETKALFIADDGNDKVIYRQNIEHTDFPLDEI